MPLGAWRLNGLAKLLAAAIPSRTPKTLTANNGAALSTSTYQFGTASIYFDGTDDTVTSADNNDWTLSTGPYTIEFWMRTSDSLSEVINAQDYNTYNGWAIGVRSSQRVLYVAGNGSSLSVLVPGTGNFTDDVWTHVAVCKDSGTNVAIFVGGSRVYSNSGWNVDIADTTNGLRIGTGYGVSGTFADGPFYYQGYIDEVRISTVDRYGATNSSYTVPTAAFTNDADTVLLLHCDGSNGSTTITDDGGPQ